ncbi:MAG: hypothetical protein ACI8ZB_003787 [Desulforhopalus sp.]|jgi:hypothetical protein
MKYIILRFGGKLQLTIAYNGHFTAWFATDARR